MGTSSRDLSKENRPAASMKSFMSVFRPIRDWINPRPKTSTPISNPIVRSSSANGHIQRNNNHSHHQHQHHQIATNISNNNLNNIQHVNGINNINNHHMNNNIHNNSNSNSYGGDSLMGSSGDMLSSAAPTPIHHQHQNSTFQQRFTPIPNGHGGGMAGNPSGLMNTLDELNSTNGFSVRENGDGSVININRGVVSGGGADADGMGSTMELSQQFSRSAQARMSLPIMQQNKLRRQAYSQLQRRGQQVARSLGHIYLQHKGETKQASLPNELTTLDTIRALFVCAFPRLLTMEYMCQPHVKIYIYNPSCNIFYELCDIEDVRHESVLRIHHSDPLIPLALPTALSMVSMNGVPTAPAALAHNPYATLHRVPPRLPPQIPQQQQPLQQQRQQQQPQQQHQQQQQSPQQQQQQQQQPQITKQQNPPIQAPINSQHTGLGQATSMMQHHHMMQSMVMGPLGAIAQPHHHHYAVPPMPHISQIPPPKPRRMLASSYSMHRLNPTQ